MGWRAAAIAIGVVMFVADGAQAAAPATVMGKWIERFPNGKGMVTEFASGAIASYAVDQTAKPQGAANRAAVSYKDLGGDLVGVQFSGGGSGGGIMLQRTGANSLTMDFPGMGAHKLTRLGR